MTNLMIDRNNWLEAIRHNSAQEAESNRHNAEMEKLQAQQNEETKRANLEREAYNRASLAESQRHSQVAESQNAASIQESVRSSLAREAENSLHNRATEALSQFVEKQGNLREWRKLSLNEQRNSVQNALDSAKTQATKLENLISKLQIKAGMPQAQVNKILAEIDSTKRNIQLAEKSFTWKKHTDLENLNLNERKVASDEMLNEAKVVSEEFTQLEKASKTVSEWIRAFGLLSKLK